MLVEELLIMAILYLGINKLWQTHVPANIFYFYKKVLNRIGLVFKISKHFVFS
jgi:hypothetical protein